GIRRGRRISAPPAATRPRLTSGVPKRASRAATIRSQARAISNPPATAQPSTAAISGLRGGAWTMPAKPRPATYGRSPATNAFRSIPAQRVVAVQPLERRGDALRHREVDRVARLRPVDRDDQDAAVGLGADGAHPN